MKNRMHYLLSSLLPFCIWVQLSAIDNSCLYESAFPPPARSEGILPDAQHQNPLSLPHELATRYLFIVTTDGFRWQELFAGADSALLFDPVSRVLDTVDAVTRFWASMPDARRAKLLPFLWSTFVQEGQLYGNRYYDNKMDIANCWAFSYPGYNEMFTGRPDNWRIFSNRKIYNPNKNVLEFFHQQPRLQGKVAVFTSWDAFPYILNTRRAGISVSSGKKNRQSGHHNVHLLPSKFDDPFTWSAGMNHIREHHPHVVYIGLNATDLLGHSGNYPAYLFAAHQFDKYIGELWTYIQQDSMYRGQSTLLITTDHGRGGKKLRRWMEHNRHLPGSNQVWLGIVGPDTPPTGEVKVPMQLWQKQFAQTASSFLSLEFRRARKVAPAISFAFFDQ